MRKLVMLLMVCVCMTGIANAGLTNGSFESPALDEWTPNQQASGWTYFDVSGWGGGYYGAGTAHPAWGPAWQPADGTQFIAIRSYALWQTSDMKFVEGVTYTLGVWSVQENPRSSNLGMSIVASDSAAILGDAIVASTAVEPLTTSMSEFSLSYTATAADAGKWIQVCFYENPNVNSGLWIDNATLVPEPATLTCLALGGLAFLRRNRK
ncbi:MAG: hypothetical protein A2Y12_08970 [Planctomycetes bacterium GWF2_42_9]|nr:MAG: hypothetical protein A2Y12_08970 [Planctomycetes bacterium GWF2_42_9]